MVACVYNATSCDFAAFFKVDFFLFCGTESWFLLRGMHLRKAADKNADQMGPSHISIY